MNKHQKQSNTQEESLVFGYCHIIKNKKLIPNDVIRICLQYYQSNSIINITIGDCMTHSLNFFKSLLKEYNINRHTGNTYLRTNNNKITFRSLFIDNTPGMYHHYDVNTLFYFIFNNHTI